MASLQLVATLGTNSGGAPLSVGVRSPGDNVATLPATTTVNTDVATLVADGATPTQAHVTTLDTDWTAYKAALTAYSAASLSGNFAVSIDLAAVTTKRQARACLDAIWQAIQAGAGGLAP